jgi:hypothetical protein
VPGDTDDGVAAVVLVEGVSDQLAVETLARRLGRDLPAEGIAVVAMGGATNVSRHLEFFGPGGLDVALAGLVDEGEVSVFQRALERAGLGTELTREDMESLGFYVCVRDLEDELIRALGPQVVEQILDRQGDLHSFRTFQKQPAQRGRTDQARLRRFMGTRGGRKHYYAPVLVNALDLDSLPAPLEKLLAHL